MEGPFLHTTSECSLLVVKSRVFRFISRYCSYQDLRIFLTAVSVEVVESSTCLLEDDVFFRFMNMESVVCSTIKRHSELLLYSAERQNISNALRVEPHLTVSRHGAAHLST
jgi:hypothetical protein